MLKPYKLGWPDIFVENPGQFQRKSIKTQDMKQNLKNNGNSREKNPGQSREKTSRCPAYI
jgi:hypothetical protein